MNDASSVVGDVEDEGWRENKWYDVGLMMMMMMHVLRKKEFGYRMIRTGLAHLRIARFVDSMRSDRWRQATPWRVF